MNDQLWWHLARSSGLVAWSVACLSVFWGLALSTRLVQRKGAPAWLLETHRHLGGLTLAFAALHVAALVADDYVHFGVADVLFPFASGWRPGAVAWGIVALHLAVGVEVTSLLKRHIRRRLWRAVHLASFAVFASATVHTLTAGTDAANRFVQWTALGMVTTFCFLVAYRQLASKGRPAVAERPRLS